MQLVNIFAVSFLLHYVAHAWMPSRQASHALLSHKTVLTKRFPLISSVLGIYLTFFPSSNALALSDLGANDTSNTKILRGGASTLQRGIAKVITRGVNLDNSDFRGQNLKGVAFQQSIVRDTDFRDTNLRGASFFEYFFSFQLSSFEYSMIPFTHCYRIVPRLMDLILRGPI